MLGWLLVAVQALLAARVLTRMCASAREIRIHASGTAADPRSIAVVVPVLDEERRLGACRAALSAQREAVREMLVVGRLLTAASEA